jgi:hypothetical protein
MKDAAVVRRLQEAMSGAQASAERLQDRG